MIASESNFEPTPVHPLDATAGGAWEIRGAPADSDARIGSVRRGLLRLPARAVLVLIAGYQRFVSPVLPVVTLGACACRFSPSCSQYAAEAVRTHGVIVGAALAFRRLLKCTPLHPGGFDPVPPRRSRPTCHPVIR